jgi:hypothetical protein
MRQVLTGVVLLLTASGLSAAQADPYPWCAIYSVGDAAYNCYFLTFQQCQRTISGIGGICQPNLFYTGRPDGTATLSTAPKRGHHPG